MGQAAKLYRPTAWDEAVLGFFAVYHYLTIPQIMVLMQVTNYPKATQHIKQLVDAGFLLRIERAKRDEQGKIKRVDSAYTFGPKGYNYAKRAGILRRTPRAAKEEYLLSEAFFTHTLAATDVLLSFRSVPGIHILHEQQDQELTGTPFLITRDGQEKQVNADSVIVFTQKAQTYCCPIEIQNVGNFTRVDLGEKAANYVALFEQNVYQRHFGLSEDTVLTVLFVAVQGEVAVRNIRIAMERSLNHLKKPQLGPLFRVAPLVEDVYNLPILPVWQRPYKPEERVLFST